MIGEYKEAGIALDGQNRSPRSMGTFVAFDEMKQDRDGEKFIDVRENSS